MDTEDLLYDQWAYVRTLLPQDLEESARNSGALSRRRGVRDAEALVRTLLAYGATDLSLKSVAGWAKAPGVSDLSAPALFYRVRDAEQWLSVLLGAVLNEEIRPAAATGLRLRAVDATVVVGPGAKGTEWRVHVLADPGTGKISAVEITDEHGGEGYARQPLRPGDVVLGDRGYAYSRSIAAAVNQGAHVVVRFNPQTLRVCTPSRARLNLFACAEQVPTTGVASWMVLVPVFPPPRPGKSHKTWPLSKATGWLPARIVAARTRRQKIIWVLTTLSAEQASDLATLDLYRLRWQIELLFKRLKSLLGFDRLPSAQGPTARSWLLARLLAAAIAQKLLDPNDALSPWGYVLGRSGTGHQP
jgi:hypothetical protein